jgi:CRP/FNR family cyclic AMP-dependent transcriptional regulator
MTSRTALLGQGARLAAEGRDAVLREGWIAKAPPDFQDAMLSLAIWRQAEAGEEFIHAGDTEGGMWALARGTAEVSLGLSHPDTRMVHLFHAVFWSGYLPLLGRPRTVSLVARTRVLWCLVPQRALERLMAEEPRWWRLIAEQIANHLELAAGGWADLTRQDSVQRAIAAMLRAAGCRYRGPPDGVVAELRLGQKDLAGLAAMSRNTFGAICADLERQGLIELGYRSITLRRPDLLRAMIEEY